MALFIHIQLIHVQYYKTYKSNLVCELILSVLTYSLQSFGKIVISKTLKLSRLDRIDLILVKPNFKNLTGPEEEGRDKKMHPKRGEQRVQRHCS